LNACLQNSSSDTKTNNDVKTADAKELDDAEFYASLTADERSSLFARVTDVAKFNQFAHEITLAGKVKLGPFMQIKDGKLLNVSGGVEREILPTATQAAQNLGAFIAREMNENREPVTVLYVPFAYWKLFREKLNQEASK
jgi:hypothetical protein